MRRKQRSGIALLAAVLALLAQQGVVAAGETHGPNGERAAPIGVLTLSDAEVAKLRAGHYTAVLAWHAFGDFMVAVDAGAANELTRLGIPGWRVREAETATIAETIAKKPNIILTLPDDSVDSSASLRPAVEAGVKLVFLFNVPYGYKQGSDYVALVTDDLFQMGKQAADLLANAIGGKGKIGYIFYDGTNDLLNQRDQAFKATIAQGYPGIEIAAQQGIAYPSMAKQVIQTMLLEHPDLDGIYVMVDSADIVLRALRHVGNIHTKIVAYDLNEALSLNMAKGSNVAGVVARDAYTLGRAMADAAAYGLLGKPAPPVLVVPALTVTKTNLVDSWKASLGYAPQSVRDAAK